MTAIPTPAPTPTPARSAPRARWPRRGPMEAVATVLIAAGVLMLLQPFALVLYLAFAVGAAYGVARIRLWRWLARAAATGAILWGIPFLLGGDAWQAGLVAHVLIQLALAILFLVVDPYRGMPPEEAAIDRMATIVLFWFALLAVAAGIDLGPGLARPLFAAVVVAMLVGAAMRYPAAAGALPLIQRHIAQLSRMQATMGGARQG